MAIFVGIVKITLLNLLVCILGYGDTICNIFLVFSIPGLQATFLGKSFA